MATSTQRQSPSTSGRKPARSSAGSLRLQSDPGQRERDQEAGGGGKRRMPRGRDGAEAVRQRRAQERDDEPRHEPHPRKRVRGRVLAAGPHCGQRGRDRQDERRARQLHDRRFGAGDRTVDVSRRDDRRGVVDRRACPHRERVLRETEQMPDRREDEHRDDVVEEDRRDRDGSSAAGGSRTIATAAIADAPQIAVPTPISVRSVRSSPNARPSGTEKSSATAVVTSITGNVAIPVRTTLASESPRPETTIAACSTVRPARCSPGRSTAGSVTSEASATPRTIARTGAPTTGTNRPASVAHTATTAAARTPGSAAAAFRRRAPLRRTVSG